LALSTFDDRSRAPEEAEVASALGRSYPLWKKLRSQLSARLESPGEEWGYGSKATGWGLRIRNGKRVILYMTPRSGHFLASVVLGGRAVEAAHRGELPAPLLRTLDGSRRYAEGTGVRLEVRTAADLRSALALALLKIAY
jgi:hypothetical protein